MNNINSAHFFFLLILLVMSSADAFADYGLDKANIANVDTSKWLCRYCPDGAETQAAIEMGVLVVDANVSARFKGGEADGDRRQVTLGGELLRQTADGQWDLEANNINSDSQQAEIRYRDDANTSAEVNYQSFERFSGDGGISPFVSTNSQRLLLPNDWVAQSNTADMNFNSVRSVQAFSDIESIEVSGSTYLGQDRATVYLSYREQRRDQLEWKTGSTLNRVVALPAPQRDLTQEVIGGFAHPVAFHNGQGLVGIEIFHSAYYADNESLQWDNPFAPDVPGSDQAGMAYAPDNAFYRWQLSGQYAIASHFFSANLSRGRGQQEQALLPYTLNRSIETSELPVDAADADMTTANYRFLWRYRVNSQWHVGSEYRYDDRDNQNRIFQFEPVMTDAVRQGVIANSQHSHQRSHLALMVDWQARYATRLAYEYRFADFKRYDAAYNAAEDRAFVVTWNERWHTKVNTRLKLLTENKYVSENSPASDRFENPYFSESTFADRIRRGLDFYVDWSVNAHLDLSFNGRRQKDNYINTQVGVDSASEQHIGVDAIIRVDRYANLTASIQRASSRWQLLGSAQQSIATWSSTQKEKYDVISFAYNQRSVRHPQLSFGSSYQYVTSRAQTAVSAPGDYEDHYTYKHSIGAYFERSWKAAQWRLRCELSYERYRANAPDTIGLDTLSTFLGNGLLGENYSDWLLQIKLRHQFAH